MTIFEFWLLLRDDEKSGLDLKWQFEGHRLGVISVDLERKEGRRKHIMFHIRKFRLNSGPSGWATTSAFACHLC